MPKQTDWLDVHYRTRFRLTADRRIKRENDPDCSPGPLFWLAGCRASNIWGVRADIPREVAAELEQLAAAEPPFLFSALPDNLDRYRAILAAPSPIAPRDLGLIYVLPHGLAATGSVRLIGSESEEGQALKRSFSRTGVSSGIYEIGFRSVDDLWPPWCAALVGGEIASIAFSARLSDVGAELGVATPEAFRGRGLAAAVTRGWTRMQLLRSRMLFYSTDRGNTSSQRVAARLGLQLCGASLRIA